MYGPWSVEDADVKEVTGYRVGISVAAAGENWPFMTKVLSDHLRNSSLAHITCATHGLTTSGCGHAALVLDSLISFLPETSEVKQVLRCG